MFRHRIIFWIELTIRGRTASPQKYALERGLGHELPYPASARTMASPGVPCATHLSVRNN